MLSTSSSVHCSHVQGGLSISEKLNHNLQNILLSMFLLKLEKLSRQGSQVQSPAVSEAGKANLSWGATGGIGIKYLSTADILHSG